VQRNALAGKRFRSWEHLKAWLLEWATTVADTRMAPDCLVATGGSRYSVPARYAGEAVVVRELLGSYEILHQGAVIARHRVAADRAVVMEPAHYAGLLRPGGGGRPPRAAGPPHHDAGYPAGADVAVRDLGVYAALAEAIPEEPAG
jgi:Mu transposase, C-terminal domain